MARKKSTPAAADETAGKPAEDEDAARKAAEEETARKAAEEDAARKAAAADEAAEGKVEVTALQTIRCDGKTYKAGSKVKVVPAHAAQLRAARIAE